MLVSKFEEINRLPLINLLCRVDDLKTCAAFPLLLSVCSQCVSNLVEVLINSREMNRERGNLMNKSLLYGIWRFLVRIPRRIWQAEVTHSSHEGHDRTSFMSPDHHRVRDFVVLELPRSQAVILPEQIAERLTMPIERVRVILDELEKGMTFLFRDERGAVAWAYPVTVEPTPHRITFSSSEKIYAA